MDFSDIAFMVSTFSVIAIVVLLEVYGLVVWAIPRGLFTSALYALGCLAVDSFVAGFMTIA